MIRNVPPLLFLTACSVALASDWNVTSVASWPIKSLLGPHSPGGDHEEVSLGSCLVGIDANCLASDGGLSSATPGSELVSSWPAYVTCTTAYDATDNIVTVFASFDGGQNATTKLGLWPSAASWPSSVSCTRNPTTPNAEAGKHHALTATITSAADGADDWRFKGNVGPNTTITLAGGATLTTDTGFTVQAQEFLYDLPNATYVDSGTQHAVSSVAFMWSAATGGSVVNGTYCHIKDSPDDRILVAINRSLMPDQNGAAAGRGTVYCRASNGSAFAIPFSVF